MQNAMLSLSQDTHEIIAQESLLRQTSFSFDLSFSHTLFSRSAVLISRAFWYFIFVSIMVYLYFRGSLYPSLFPPLSIRLFISSSRFLSFFFSHNHSLTRSDSLLPLFSFYLHSLTQSASHHICFLSFSLFFLSIPFLFLPFSLSLSSPPLETALPLNNFLRAQIAQNKIRDYLWSALYLGVHLLWNAEYFTFFSILTKRIISAQ